MAVGGIAGLIEGADVPRGVRECFTVQDSFVCLCMRSRCFSSPCTVLGWAHMLVAVSPAQPQLQHSHRPDVRQ